MRYGVLGVLPLVLAAFVLLVAVLNAAALSAAWMLRGWMRWGSRPAEPNAANGVLLVVK